MTPFLYIALGIALGSMIKIAISLDRIADALEKKNKSANEAKPEDKYETEQDSIVS